MGGVTVKVEQYEAAYLNDIYKLNVSTIHETLDQDI